MSSALNRRKRVARSSAAHQSLATPARLQADDLGQLGRQPAGTSRGGSQEAFGDRAQLQERALGRGPGPHRSGRPGRRCAVVLVDDGDLPGPDERMPGDLMAVVGDDHLVVHGHYLDAPADVGGRHRVATGARLLPTGVRCDQCPDVDVRNSEHGLAPSSAWSETRRARSWFAEGTLPMV